MKSVAELAEKLDKRMERLTKHDNVHFTDRGNSAIFMALSIAKQINNKPKILIPDQGGWYSYKRYPKYFGLEIVEVKTDYGVIDLKDLKKKIKKEDVCCFIFSSFAGYFAEQPLRKMKTICKKKSCLIIEDSCGSIGDTKLCNGKYADMTVGSFGNWKPISYGYGGWISVREKRWFDNAREVMSMCKVHERFYRDIMKFIRKNKFKKLIKLNKIVKDDLKDFDIIHRDKRGLNVVVKFDPKVTEYCKEKGFQHILCPNYIRVNEMAISIELKRLDLDRIKELTSN